MKVVFRADASLTIGNGHIMRCLTLANELKLIGAECRFICRDHEGNLNDYIQELGYPVYILPMKNSLKKKTYEFKNSIHLDWLGEDLEVDAEQCIKSIKNTKVNWFIVDHYAIDYRWESMLISKSVRLLSIDDLANRSHICNILLDQNVGRKEEDYSLLVPKKCRILTGTKYALIRPDFSRIRKESLERRIHVRSVKQIFISMGGVDRFNVTCQLLEVLKTCGLKREIQIIVVMGLHSPWLREVQSLANDMPVTTEVKINVSNMASLMAYSDLAIGAAGSTSWERCCLGLPTIMIVLAENQLNGAKALEEMECAKVIYSVDEIRLALPKFLEELSLYEKLVNLSLRCSKLTDGLGTSRVKAEMEAYCD